MSLIAPLNGKLKITCIKCSELRRVQLMGKQDPYVRIYFAKEKGKTKTNKDGDRNPEWNETVEINCNNTDEHMIKIVVKNDNLGSDDEIAVLRLPVYCLLSDNIERWYTLYKTQKNRFTAGRICLRTTFEGTGGLPKAANPKWGIVSAFYGTEDRPANVKGFLEVQAQVGNGKLTFEADKNLSGFFGFDPLDGHIMAKSLELTYMKGGQTHHITVQERHPKTEIEFEDVEAKQEQVQAALEAERKRIEAEAAEKLRLANLEAERIRKMALEQKEMYEKMAREREQRELKKMQMIQAREAKGEKITIGRADRLGVWRPSSAKFYFISEGKIRDVEMGSGDMIPCPANYYGDGVRFALWCPSKSKFFVKGPGDAGWAESSDNHDIEMPAGGGGWTPVPANYYGDGVRFALYKDGTWLIKGPGKSHWEQSSNNKKVECGGGGDIPCPGNFYGDHDRVAVYRPSSSKYFIMGPNLEGIGDLEIGGPWAKPVKPANFFGDGHRPVVWHEEAGKVYFTGSDGKHWGQTNDKGSLDIGGKGDVLVTGNFFGDGVRMAVYRPSNGTWYIKARGKGTYGPGARKFECGGKGDIPVIV